MIVYSNKFQNSQTPLPSYEYEVLNELKDTTKRTDENCLFHTRFLFEMDNEPLDIQEQVWLPSLSTVIIRAVYSGGKSIHFIIELPSTCEELCRKHYRLIWDWFNENYFDNKADTQCKNPSRLTRRPGVVRSDTGKKQQLLYIGKKFDYKDILERMSKDIERQYRSVLARTAVLALNGNNYSETNINSRTKPGMCKDWPVIQRYIETPFPKRNGNGHSSTWLYAALQTTKKYGDLATQQLIIEKAKREGWSDREIQHKLQ